MSKGKELTKNTILIFIGRFCTQFISFILIPIYTRFLLASDYGYIDLIQSYISLLVPIIILRFDSAIFRFLIDERKNEENQQIIITNTVFLIMYQIVILLVISIILSQFIEINNMVYIIINVLSLTLSSIVLQLTRGIGDNKGYALSCIISALITIIFNFLFIVIFKMSGISILISSSIANFGCSLFLIFRNKVYKYIKFKKRNKIQLKKMLKYSIPMIPDGLSWWIVNVSDRTIISVLLGSAFNGVYAISCKFSNILASLFQVFNMSWQESASLYIDSDDNKIFFSNVLLSSYKVFYSICIFILGIMPLIYPLVVGTNYNESYLYIPILLLGNLVNSIGNVLGGIYIAKKNTKEVAKTTMLGALVNIILNILFIKHIGLWAASLSTLISYIVVAIYRYFDSRKYLKLTINFKFFALSLLLFGISLTFYYINNLYLNILNMILICIYIFIFNKDNILDLKEIVLSKIKK